MAWSDSVTLLVEFAFGSTWLDDPAGFVWTDVSGYAFAVSSRRGRSSELDLFAAGTVSIQLRNDDRRFDPLHSAGPYYGDLVPNVPVRIRATHDASTYPLFFGYVDGWRHQPGTVSGTVTVNATDAFKVLAWLRLRDVYQTTVIADAPHAYWPLSGSEGDAAMDASGNRYDGTYSGEGIERDVAGLRLFSTGATLPGGGPWPSPRVDAGAGPRVTALPFSVEFWCLCEDATLGAFVIGQGRGTDSSSFNLPILSSGDLAAVVVMGGVATTSISAAAGLTDGLPHHVVYTIDGASTQTVYVDGVSVPTTSGLPSTGPTSAAVLWLGSAPWSQTSDGAVTLSDVAVYTSALSAAVVEAHYNTGRAPWSGDQTGTRVGRVLDQAGWPASLRAIDTGEVPCGNADIAGVDALAYLQAVAQSEWGRLFMSADGKVTFHDASKTLTGTSVYTFTDAGTGTGIIEGSLSFSLDDTFLYDGAEIQKKYGAAQYAGAATPTRTFSAANLVMRDDAAARNLAESIAARYSTAQTRAETWTVFPDRDPASWGDVLGLELGDVVTLTVTPQRVGSSVSVDLFVEQISHDITPGGWSVTFYGSPVDNRDLFVFGGAAVNGFDAGVWR